MKSNGTITSFADLLAWQEGHKLLLMVYGELKYFPNSQRYILSSQIQRAGISITSNIAEGFSRNSNKDKAQFYYIALGSLTELQNQLMLARDLEYISLDNFQVLSNQGTKVSKLINGLIKSAQNLPSQYT